MYSCGIVLCIIYRESAAVYTMGLSGIPEILNTSCVSFVEADDIVL